MKTKTEPAAQRHPTAGYISLESNERGERKTTRDTEPQPHQREKNEMDTSAKHAIEELNSFKSSDTESRTRL